MRAPNSLPVATRELKMADIEKRSFPQIPTTVWWGIRERFKKSIPAAVTESLLVAELNVHGSAARGYLSELKRLGLIDDEGKPLDVAKKWRMDETYREASDHILRNAYPAELIETAPPSSGDRAKAVRWFMQVADLGEGAASNKAGTYFLIGAAEPPDDAPKARASGAGDKPKRSATSKAENVAGADSPKHEKRDEPPPAGKFTQPSVREGFKADTYTTAEGDVTLSWPTTLSAESLDELEEWTQLILRKIRREVQRRDRTQEFGNDQKA